MARTKRDVITAGASLLLEAGWNAMTHAAVARRAGYSKATVYAHWPTTLDLMRDVCEQICAVTEDAAPPATGNLRDDLHSCLSRFSHTLTRGRFDLLLAGVVERGGRDEVARDLGNRLYEAGTSGLRRILDAHLESAEARLTLTLLVGAVVVRATYEGKAISDAFITDIINRTLPAD